MKRRTFLKYLCSVVPVALVDPMYFAKDEILGTVSFGAIYPSPPEVTIRKASKFKKSDFTVTAGADIQHEGVEGILIKTFNRDGEPDTWHIYLK